MDQNLIPKVSINIATYNRANYISQAIDSVLAQTFKNWELVIVDDGSTDDTKEVIRPYLIDPRIKYYANETNRNISHTRNRGLELSSAPYIAILDSDDIWADPTKLERQISFLDNHQDYAAVGTNVIVINQHGNEVKRYQNPSSDKEIKAAILSRNPFAHSSIIYRKLAALEAGCYDLSLNGIEDYDLWLKMGRKHKLANLHFNGLKYRIHDKNISSSNRLRLMSINLDLTRKYRPSYPNYWFAYARRLSRYAVFRLASIIKS